MSRRSSLELRFLRRPVMRKRPSFLAFPFGAQDPIHRRDRAKVRTLIEQRRDDLANAEVAEPFAVNDVENVRAFCIAKSTMRFTRLQSSRFRGQWLLTTLHRGARCAENYACSSLTDGSTEHHDDFLDCCLPTRPRLQLSARARALFPRLQSLRRLSPAVARADRSRALIGRFPPDRDLGAFREACPFEHSRLCANSRCASYRWLLCEATRLAARAIRFDRTLQVCVLFLQR